MRSVRIRVLLTAAAAAAVAVAAAGCSPGSPSRPEAVPTSMTLTSSAFADGAPIPEQFSCEGDNQPPPLAWTGVPGSAKELAVVVIDPQAPQPPFIHWVVMGLAPSVTSVDSAFPPGARLAQASTGDGEYVGMCPPNGQTHLYVFTVYALKSPVGLDASADGKEAIAAIEAKAIAKGTLTGTFGRA